MNSHRMERVYHLLVSAGHQPNRAVEIIIDARRHDKIALKWIRAIRAVSDNSYWIARRAAFNQKAA